MLAAKISETEAFFASLKTLAFNGNAKPPDALTVKDPFDIRFYTPVTTESCAKLATALVNLDKESKVAEIYYGYKAPIAVKPSVGIFGDAGALDWTGRGARTGGGAQAGTRDGF